MATNWKNWDPNGYDAEIAAELKIRGFHDASWENDACPSFCIFSDDGEALQRVWLDFVNVDDREDTTCKRFAFGNDDDGIDVESDDFADILRAIDARVS